MSQTLSEGVKHEDVLILFPSGDEFAESFFSGT